MSNMLPTSDSYSLHYTQPFITRKLSELLISYLPKSPDPIIILCIGTDRSTGDSLGPLTGTFFERINPVHLTLYGTLHKPVHALNLEDQIKTIYNTYENPFIIAIDASLGRLQSIGHITTSEGPLLPGAAFNKGLPPVGHAHLTGIVNISGMMEYNVLQSTKLSIVYDMAKVLSGVLFQMENHISRIQHSKQSNINTTKRVPVFKINGQYI